MSDKENKKSSKNGSTIIIEGSLKGERTSIMEDGSRSYAVDVSLSDADPSITTNTSNPPIQIVTPTDSFSTLRDEGHNTILEAGFEERIMISNDFKPNEIEIKIESNSFTVSGRKDVKPDPKSTTITTHSFFYIREFNRPIRNVEMEVGTGVAKVYGEFADF